MKRLALALVLVVLGAGPSRAADDVSVRDLITESPAYDSSLLGEISVMGELVGDFQRRGDWVWVQLNDDPYVSSPLLAGGEFAGANVGIGVRLPAAVFADLGVDSPGGYRVRGPVVRLTGEWRHHDPSRGGESFFDATAAELLDGERRLEEGVRWWALLTGAGLLLAAALPALPRRRRRG